MAALITETVGRFFEDRGGYLELRERCREFAGDHPIGITVLRLGRLVYEEDAAGRDPDLMWLDPRDAAQAVDCALRADASRKVRSAQRWRVLHVCADIPRPKYLIERARAIGYEPTHDFADAWTQGGG
jgi:hypothetical protein